MRSPGISLASAYVILAKIVTDMPLPHRRALGLLGPAGPRHQGIGGKKKGKGPAGHGNAHLASVLGNTAARVANTDTFLGGKYRRIARRRGSKRAIVAHGRSILVIAWHLLSDPQVRFYDLGPGYYAAVSRTATMRTPSAARQPQICNDVAFAISPASRSECCCRAEAPASRARPGHGPGSAGDGKPGIYPRQNYAFPARDRQQRRSLRLSLCLR